MRREDAHSDTIERVWLGISRGGRGGTMDHVKSRVSAFGIRPAVDPLVLIFGVS
jgi:hypothetical protein